MKSLELLELAGLLNISYRERENISMDSNFTHPGTKSKKMLSVIIEKGDCNKELLLRIFEAMKREDLKEVIIQVSFFYLVANKSICGLHRIY